VARKVARGKLSHDVGTRTRLDYFGVATLRSEMQRHATAQVLRLNPRAALEQGIRAFQAAIHRRVVQRRPPEDLVARVDDIRRAAPHQHLDQLRSVTLNRGLAERRTSVEIRRKHCMPLQIPVLAERSIVRARVVCRQQRLRC
jgi:hypothetical protein